MKAYIKIACTHVIDASSDSSFEKDVFHDSYREFLLKSQSYNLENKFTSFAEMVQNEPKANSLHYKVGFSVGLYINELMGIMPCLKDSLGLTPIRFEAHKFHVIASDVKDLSKHKVAIIYITESLTLLDSFGDNLLLAYGERAEQLRDEEMGPQVIEDSFILQLKEGLSIVSYQPVEQQLNPLTSSTH